MIVVGIHMGHDAAVSVVEDGVIKSYVEKERHTRVKHAAISTYDDIELALDDAGCGVDDIDYVAITATQNWPFVFYDKHDFFFEIDTSPPAEFRVPASIVSSLPKVKAKRQTGDEFARWRIRETILNTSSSHYSELVARDIDLDDPSLFISYSREFDLYRKSWDERLCLREFAQTHPGDRFRYASDEIAHLLSHLPVSVNLKGRRLPGAIFPHHLAHAANAFYQSDKDEAAIMTYDGSAAPGDFGHGEGLFCLGRGNRLVPVIPNFLPSGNIYSRVAAAVKLGGGLGGSGKLMGLAPYGEAALFHEKFVGNIHDAPDLLNVHSDDLPDGYKAHNHAFKWLQYCFTKAKELGYTDTETIRQAPFSKAHADLAASTQLLFEEQSLLGARALANIKRAVFGTEPGTICLSGGCALNCPSNSRIWQESEFDEIFVPPTCDDSGLAIGSALLMTHNILDLPRQPQGAKTSTSAYLGRRHSQASIDTAVRKASDKIKVSEVANAPEDAAQSLVEDKIVAWYEGRSEIGPRALGHRSILSDPRQGANWKRVNQVKRREEWRPFAPAVLEEKAADWFEGAQLPSPFMLYTAQVKNDQIPAITHVDGSARIQTVSEDCGGYRQVIEAFDRKTGVPVVMNTSLNGPGEPIVETPEDALRFIESSGADCLYIGGYKLERADTPNNED